MEHRWSVRKTHASSATIDAPTRDTKVGWMRNVSVGGMFVETGPVLWPVNTPVYVGFTLAGEDNDEAPFRLPGLVVRHAPGGLGVMFLETSADVLGALRRALYAQQLAHPGQWPDSSSVVTYRLQVPDRLAQATDR